MEDKNEFNKIVTDFLIQKYGHLLKDGDKIEKCFAFNKILINQSTETEGIGVHIFPPLPVEEAKKEVTNLLELYLANQPRTS